MCNNYLQVILHHYRSNASTLAPLTHFTSIDLVMMTFPITHSSSGIAAEIISTFQNLLWKRLGKFYFYNTMFNSDPCKSDIYICSFGDTSTAPYLTPGYRSCSLAIQIPDQYHIPHTHMHSSDCCPFSPRQLPFPFPVLLAGPIFSCRKCFWFNYYHESLASTQVTIENDSTSSKTA